MFELKATEVPGGHCSIDAARHIILVKNMLMECTRVSEAQNRTESVIELLSNLVFCIHIVPYDTKPMSFAVFTNKILSD